MQIMKGFTLAACGHEYHDNCKRCPTCRAPNPGKFTAQEEVPDHQVEEAGPPPAAHINGVPQRDQEARQDGQAVL